MEPGAFGQDGGVSFFFFFFGRSASREAMELWTVGQTFEANRWGCFGFRLNWVCVVSFVFL